MGYATVSHVEDRNRGRTGTSAWPAASAIVNYLEETAGVLDGLLAGRGYSIPIATDAATSARRTLEGFNSAGAWYMVELSSKSRDKVQFEAAKQMWESAQKMLTDGIIELDLPLDAAESLPRGGFGGNSSSATPFFTRDMVL
jgi:hypothetical protein